MPSKDKAPADYCNRDGCEFVAEPHMHVAALPAGWSVDSGTRVPLVVDPPEGD